MVFLALQIVFQAHQCRRKGIVRVDWFLNRLAVLFRFTVPRLEVFAGTLVVTPSFIGFLGTSSLAWSPAPVWLGLPLALVVTFAALAMPAILPVFPVLAPDDHPFGFLR